MYEFNTYWESFCSSELHFLHMNGKKKKPKLKQKVYFKYMWEEMQK